MREWVVAWTLKMVLKSDFLYLRICPGTHKRSYHVKYARSRPIPEAKLRRAESVVRSVRTCEASVLLVFCLSFLFDLVCMNRIEPLRRKEIDSRSLFLQHTTPIYSS